jgi:hypothetical protein
MERRYGRGRSEIERLAAIARAEIARSPEEARRIDESRDCRHAYARGRSDEYMEIVDAVTETLEECRAAPATDFVRAFTDRYWNGEPPEEIASLLT